MQNIQRSHKSTNVILTVAICIFITMVSTPLQVYIPKLLRYLTYLVCIAATALGMIDGDSRFVSNSVLVFVIVMLLGVVYYPKWAWLKTFIEFLFDMFMFAMPLLWEHYSLKLPRRYKLIIRNLFIVVALATTITTIIGHNLFPEASRILTTGVDSFTREEKTTYSKHNIGGYAFSYGMVLLLPYLLYSFQNKKNVLYLLWAGAVVYLAIKTQFTIAVILCGLEIVLCFSTSIKEHALTWLLWFLAVLLLAVVGFCHIDTIANFFYEKGFNSIAVRVSEISNLLHQGMRLGDLSTRFSLYSKSLETFLRYPVTGAGLFAPDDLVLGGHSEIFDLMGCSGLAGLGCFACLLRVHWECNAGRKKSAIFKFYVVSFIGYICFSLVNMSFLPYIGFVFFMCPAIFDC